MSQATKIGAHVLLFFLVFGMSATVDIGQMRKQLRNRTAILIGIILQFVILPFVGFGVVKLLNMDAAIGVTLLVVTSSPGGSYSNCEYFTVINILGPFQVFNQKAARLVVDSLVFIIELNYFP